MEVDGMEREREEGGNGKGKREGGKREEKGLKLHSNTETCSIKPFNGTIDLKLMTLTPLHKPK